MRAALLQLLKQKVSEALRYVDEETASHVRDEWGAINPSPTCPASGDVMARINQICHRGLVMRGEKAREVVASTLSVIKKPLNKNLVDEIVDILKADFPENQYVSLAQNTKGVYMRSQAPTRKFEESEFDLQVAAFSACSANSSRQAIANIRSAVNELLLQKTSSELTWWERAKEAISQKLVEYAVNWVVGIAAIIIMGAISFYFEIL